jgi:hypothetical protein
MASVTKGWTYNASTGKHDFKVYNSSNVEKTVFDEDGALYHQGTKLTPTAAEINATKVISESVLFTEAGAGTYTGSISIPAGAVIQDVIIHAIALWAAATSAALNVGDATDPNGIYAAVDLKATDLLADESISFAFAGGKQGADLDVCGTGFHVRRRYLAAARVISGVIASVGAGTTGRTLMTVIYTVPVQTAATKA